MDRRKTLIVEADSVAEARLREMIEDAVHRWVHQHLPKELPRGWCLMKTGVDGALYTHDDGLAVIVSGAMEQDGKHWLHISYSRRDGLPSYQDGAGVKKLFIGDEWYAYAVWPPARVHVNLMSNCLHLWSCVDEPDGQVLPEFSRGSGSI